MTDETDLTAWAQGLLDRITRIEADIDDFDGDRRGHYAALSQAENALRDTAPDLARALIASEAARKLAEERLAKAVEALAWYGEQSRLARLIHSEGDAGRQALGADGGKRARAVIKEITE